MAVSKKTKATITKKTNKKSNKVTMSGHTGSTKKAAPKKTKTVSAAQKQSRIETMNQFQDYQAFEMGVTIFVAAIVSVFLYLSFFRLAGKAGDVVGGLFFGFFGWFSWFFPIMLLTGIVFCTVNRGDKRVSRRVCGFSGAVLSLLGLTDLLFQKQIISEYYVSNHVFHTDYFECMYLTCHDVMSRGRFNGGLLGRWIGTLFSVVLGKVAAVILLLAVLLFFLYLFYGVELMTRIRKRNAYHQEMEEIYEQVSGQEEYQKPSYRMFSTTKENKKRRSAPALEKVPKVQSFDLYQLNQRMERMEEVVEEAMEEKRQSMGMEGKRLSIGMEEIKKEEILDTDKAVKKADAVSAKEDEIPIYRNELAEKFGKKKNTARAVKIHQVISDREDDAQSALFDAVKTTNEEEKTSILHNENDNSIAVEQKEEAAKLNANVQETAEVLPKTKKPMASFAYKEEVTDVTPSYLKQEVESASEPEMTPASKTISRPIPISKPMSEPKPMPVSKQMPKPKTTAEPKPITEQKTTTELKSLQENREQSEETEEFVPIEVPYRFPPLTLLQQPKPDKNAASDSELRQTALNLQETLKSFNVNVQMGAVTCGPSVTRYELFPEQGVRVNKITNLADDLKLSLAAQSIRIEAPIPGKAAVGIEVPNPVPGMVCFRELLEGTTFQDAKSPLTFAVGKDIAGKLIMADIGKMPHLLIAGATGSGKSVCINTLLMSILYKADPKDVKLIMIDPKFVELSVYNGIPHLFCPVVTDPKEAAAALNWAVREMTERYEKFKEVGVRNIAGYNQKIQNVENASQAGYEKMPYLIVIVDEFADLMMVASKEVEDAVCRLAQLARAAGIHLVLATQRPSVNVITGVIKANIPSRIAFSVSSATDSRTIIDKGGAEKLLGKGDMLFFPSGYTEPVRVQGAFVSDEEVSAVVDFLIQNNRQPEYNTAVTRVVEEPKENAAEEKKPANDRDEYFEEAGRFVIESERAAAGQLQRRFSIGFNRAGRIIDQLHKAGVVGPAKGTKPRMVLMDMQQFEQLLEGKDVVVSEEEMEAMSREMDDELTATMEE